MIKDLKKKKSKDSQYQYQTKSSYKERYESKRSDFVLRFKDSK